MTSLYTVSINALILHLNCTFRRIVDPDCLLHGRGSNWEDVKKRFNCGVLGSRQAPLSKQNCETRNDRQSVFEIPVRAQGGLRAENEDAKDVRPALSRSHDHLTSFSRFMSSMRPSRFLRDYCYNAYSGCSISEWPLLMSVRMDKASRWVPSVLGTEWD
jgi:hypothetical protein